MAMTKMIKKAEKEMKVTARRGYTWVGNAPKMIESKKYKKKYTDREKRRTMDEW